MTAGRLIFPNMMPAVAADGSRYSGAKAYFYENGGSTPASVYTTSALTVAHANPVVASSLGVWPSMWADITDEFTVAITDRNGVPIAGPWDDMVASQSAQTAAVALAESSADEAAASAASALGAPGTSATSTTSLTIGTGSKTFTLAQAGKAFSLGQRIVAASAANALNQMSGIITTFSDPSLTVSIDTTAGSGTLADWEISLTGGGAVSSVAGLTGAIGSTALKTAVSLENVDNVPVLGKHAFPIPVAAMTPRSTNGAAPGLSETTTNKIMLRTLDFDASTIEYAQFSVPMPASWDEGTITFEPVWTHGATATNFGVSWGLQAVAISNDEPLDAAFGTAQYSNDTGGTTNDQYTGPESAAITVAGTPAAGDYVVFQVFRKADDATNDTLAVDAKLLGIRLFITTDAAVDG